MVNAMQGSPTFGGPPPQGGPAGFLGQQGSPMFPQQYPAPYTPVQTNGLDISAIMNLVIIMMVMMMMMRMMKGAMASAY